VETAEKTGKLSLESWLLHFASDFFPQKTP